MSSRPNFPLSVTDCLIQFAKFAALVSVAFFCIAGGLFAVTASTVLADVQQDAKQATQSVTDTSKAASELLAAMDRPCGEGKPCGTLAKLNQVLNDTDHTVKHTDVFTSQEEATLGTAVQPLIDQAHGALANVDRATADLHPLLQEVTNRTRDLAPVESNAAQLVADADQTVRDPAIAASLGSIQESTAQLAIASKAGAETAVHVDAIAADGQQEVHSLLHPKPMVSVANWTLKVVHALGGFF